VLSPSNSNGFYRVAVHNYENAGQQFTGADADYGSAFAIDRFGGPAHLGSLGGSRIMRIVSYIIVAIGVLLLANAGYDEFRGSTHAPTGRYNRISYAITKNGNPEEFHNAMVVHLCRSFLFSLAGVILFMIDRGQEKVDPMSADSNEKIDEELRQDELDGEKSKLKEQGKYPKL
jgi:hypothetical protein